MQGNQEREREEKRREGTKERKEAKWSRAIGGVSKINLE